VSDKTFSRPKIITALQALGDELTGRRAILVVSGLADLGWEQLRAGRTRDVRLGHRGELT